MKKKYKPLPLDTTNIELPEELDELTELLAQNVHDVWAVSRMAEGWVYGPERNDTFKTNPCLVPYKELPDKEKVYDQNITIETLKMILKLGFSIQKNNNGTVAFL